MNSATLRRGASTDEGTQGELSFGGKVLSTMELPWRGNAPQRSCIPPGTYTCEKVNSPKFGSVYEVKNVPGRSHILIHAANFAGDVEKGFKSELLGCIAPCLSIGRMASEGKEQMAGISSRKALRIFEEWSHGSPFTLTVV